MFPRPLSACSAAIWLRASTTRTSAHGLHAIPMKSCAPCLPRESKLRRPGGPHERELGATFCGFFILARGVGSRCQPFAAIDARFQLSHRLVNLVEALDGE